jgi:bifunctional non-homologous end joining protein LigD
LANRRTRPSRARPAARARRLSPAGLEGAVGASLPPRLGPQLATLSRELPAEGDWLYELKLDGYRILARVSDERVRLFTRRGHDWTARMAPLARAVQGLGLRSAWLDGEIVVVGKGGAPDFNALQNAFDSTRTESIRYYLFDLPCFDGYDLRRTPLRMRRALLEQVLTGKTGDAVRFSAALPGSAKKVLERACKMGFEGILAKRADAPYVSARTTTWLKLKCAEQQEFVVVGYTDRTGSTTEIGSLLLGLHGADGELVFAGGVGTGWSSATARDLKARLRPLEVPKPAFARDASAGKGRWSRRAAGAERWVKPELVVQVAFAGWTPDGSIRHGSFQGIRTDKPAKAVTQEPVAVAPRPAKAKRSRAPSGRVIVSNPDRVIDASTGFKKLDLVLYYTHVADRLLPHLLRRPVSFLRGPTGVAGQLFFQKHGEKLDLPGLRKLDPKLWPGHEALLEVTNVEAVVGAAQMNVIEFHTGNSTITNIDRPDRIVFDLDPGEGVSWERVQEAALLTRTLLTELGLESWLKTSGGRGLHLVVPIEPRRDYEIVKGFAKAVVEHLARTLPARFVAVSGAANRVGKIYVDFVRNSRRATTASAYSARARPGLGVSMPVSWAELSSLKGGNHWDIASAQRRISAQRSDPWRAYGNVRQSLTDPMKALGYVPAKGSRRSG